MSEDNYPTAEQLKAALTALGLNQPSKYRSLAGTLLGRNPMDPMGAPLVPPTINWNKKEDIEYPGFVGDFSEEDDRALYVAVKDVSGLSLDEWDRLSEDGRIPFLKKAITWRNRPGRRKKSERDSDSLALAALCKHHGLDGNSVGNFEHATNRGLAAEFNKGKKANELKLSENALSRFLKNKNYALRKYKVACCDKSIGTVLALWRGELPSRLAKLKDDEQDHHDDD